MEAPDLQDTAWLEIEQRLTSALAGVYQPYLAESLAAVPAAWLHASVDHHNLPVVRLMLKPCFDHIADMLVCLGRHHFVIALRY